MAGGGQNDPDEAITGINVTPLVDITLVLLIIFMVTAKIIVSQSVPLDLPKASQGVDVQVVFSVTMAADGTAQVDGKAIPSDDGVLALATAAQQKTPDLRAVIKADSAVPHGRVIHVLDLLKQAHVNKIAFGVTPVPPLIQTPTPREAMDESPSSSHIRVETASRPGSALAGSLSTVVGPSRDPLSGVERLGVHRPAVVTTIAFLLAMLVHGTAAARVAMIDLELMEWTHQLRLAINDKLASTYDVDVEKPKEPEPPPPPPKEEPKEEKAPPPPAPKESAPPPPPPAAAQAGKVLTQEPDNTPVDFTNTFVTGNGETYAGGVTQATGTSTTAVYNRNAQAGGVPGGTGTQPASPAPPAPDRSRPLSVVGNDWHCDFPPEADSEQIDEMVVPTEVTVNAQGRVTAAHATKDPGYGFARAAVQCALRQGPSAFQTALDRDGNAIPASRTLNVHFTR